ncbi:MAG TPA: toxin TcdB middle/C-terminal domain-containing protein, partial [Longimicrobiaceae bacterium]|nr:toxin TcdB middle/C-terminal domain-containing protein [Longimicrobiaceae bacterium]
QRFRYHDGYWDPVEREFNGFGYVESWDAESFDEAAPPSAEAYVPPAYTRAWYHTGAYEDAGPIAAAYRAEFWHGDPLAYPMPGAYFGEAVQGADASTQRQAHRALRGMELRREVYGDDGTPRAADPYTVADTCWLAQPVQPGENGRAAVFYVRPRESIGYDYEREPADPRVRHDFVLEDTLFAPGGAEEYRVRSCTVDYPRRPSASPDVCVYSEQAELRATATEERRTRILHPYRMVGVTFERRAFELSGVSLDGARFLTFDAAAAQVRAALENPIPYGVPFTPGATQARTFSWQQSYFWDEAQSAALPLGRVSPRALPHHAPAAVFTDAWLEEAYGGRVDAALLEREGGYARTEDGYWWNRGVVQHFFIGPERFYLPCETANDFAFVDPAATDGLRVRTTRAYDAPHYVAEVEVREVLDGETALVTRAELDYHVVQPWQLTDSNGVVSQVLHDPLGRVTATSVFKPAEGDRPREGDGDLREYVVRPEATFATVLADKPYYLQQATTFLFYDPWAFERDGQPASTVALERQVHVGDLPPGEESPIQAQVSFSDGLERVVVAKAEAGDEAGRWIASGRTVYNNKGEPAEQYLPYDSATPYYEAEAEGPDLPPTVTRYDPLLRPVRVDTPQGFFTRTVYQAWQRAAYDENDTVRDSAYWLAHAGDPDLSREERDALEKAAACYDTPAVTVLESGGVPVREVLDNLGSVPPDAFTAVVAGTEVTSEQ